jgi:hypothetical protein
VILDIIDRLLRWHIEQDVPGIFQTRILTSCRSGPRISRDFNTFNKEVFLTCWRQIPSGDMKVIEVLGKKEARDMRLLFSPALEDVRTGPMKNKNWKLPTAYMKEQLSLPTMHDTDRLRGRGRLPFSKTRFPA